MSKESAGGDLYLSFFIEQSIFIHADIGIVKDVKNIQWSEVFSLLHVVKVATVQSPRILLQYLLVFRHMQLISAPTNLLK